MGVYETTTEIEYPESDGRPMGETDIHRGWMIRIYDLLAQRYRGQRVYVGSDLLLYYEEGNPKRFVVPDVFVVKGVAPGMRRTYRLWEEGKPPEVVIEVTSRATRRTDEHRKPDVYAEIGVKELFLYDPTCEYLDPPLRGYHLKDGEMVRMPPGDRGLLASEELDVWLTREGASLVLIDRTSNQRLLTAFETQNAAREAAEAKTAALEAEVVRLRRQLKQQGESGE